MYKTEDSKLKMYTFTISEKDASKDGVSVVFCYNLEDALNKVHKEVSKLLIKFPDVKLLIQHKGTQEVEKIGLDDFIAPVEPYKRKILKKQKVESISQSVANTLTYLLKDDNAKKERKKLTTRDLNDIKRIINKIKKL